MNNNIIIKILEIRERLEKNKLVLLRRSLIKNSKKSIKVLRTLKYYLRNYVGKLDQFSNLGIKSEKLKNYSNFLNILTKELSKKERELANLNRNIISNYQKICKVENKIKQWEILQLNHKKLMLKNKKLLDERICNEVLQDQFLRR